MTLLYNVVAVTTVLCSYSYEIIDHHYRCQIFTVCSLQPSIVCGFLSNGSESVFLYTVFLRLFSGNRIIYSVLSNHPKFAKAIRTTRITETEHSGFKYLFYYILDRHMFYVLFLLCKLFLQK